MKIFLTGATGYVGGFILDELLKQGHTVRCLVRSKDDEKSLPSFHVETVLGDVTNLDSLKVALDGCEAIIHLIAIIEENKSKNITFERINFQGTQNMVEAATEQRVARFIHMSALNADAQGFTPYYVSKGKAENAVRHSGLNFTIFRPSFILGPGDAVYTMLANMIRRIPFAIMPIFGDGSYRHQPMSVYNVAEGFVNCLQNPKAFHRTYNAGGPESFTYREQLEIIAELVGKRLNPVHIPMPLSKVGVSLTSWLPFSPIDRDRLAMLIHDNVCDPSDFSNDLNIDLWPFKKSLHHLKSD